MLNIARPRPLAPGSGGLALVVMVLAVVAGVRPASAQPEEREHARARLVSEYEALVPGKTNWLGLAFEIDEDWHLYWNGLNDTGFPVLVKTKAPEGYKVGEIAWPAPVRHIAPGDLLDHIYEKRVTLLIPVEVPAAAAGSKAAFEVDANWLVCMEACIPGSAVVKLEVQVGKSGAEPPKSKDARLFDEARSLLPKPLGADDTAVQVAWKDGGLVVRSDKEKDLAFYPGAGSAAIAELVTAGASKSGTLTLRPEKPDENGRIVGVVELGSPARSTRTLYWLDVATGGGNGPKSGASNGASK